MSDYCKNKVLVVNINNTEEDFLLDKMQSNALKGDQYANDKWNRFNQYLRYYY